MKLHRRRMLQLTAAAATVPTLPRIASALDYPTLAGAPHRRLYGG